MRSSLAAATGLVAGCLLVTACSATPSQSARSPSVWSTLSPSSSPTPSEDAVEAPLTGLPADAQSTGLPAVAVSVLAGTGGPEPAGLATADLVYEELADAGTSHLLAVFQSRDAARVGPVDVAMPVHLALLPVLHPAYAYTGGPTGFTAQVASAGIDGVDERSTPEAFTDGYTSTTRVLDHARDVRPPPPVLRYAGATHPLVPDAKAAIAVTVTPPGGPPQVWTWDGGDERWRRTSGPSGEVAVANLVVQHTEYKAQREEHLPGGSTSTAVVTGRGDCVAFGRAQWTDCTWSRPSGGERTDYVGPSGAAVLFQPGSTWFVLAPPGTEVTAR